MGTNPARLTASVGHMDSSSAEALMDGSSAIHMTKKNSQDYTANTSLMKAVETPRACADMPAGSLPSTVVFLAYRCLSFSNNMRGLVFFFQWQMKKKRFTRIIRDY